MKSQARSLKVQEHPLHRAQQRLRLTTRFYQRNHRALVQLRSNPATEMSWSNLAWFGRWMTPNSLVKIDSAIKKMKILEAQTLSLHPNLKVSTPGMIAAIISLL